MNPVNDKQSADESAEDIILLIERLLVFLFKVI